MNRLTGKTVLISGAAGGMGSAHARECVRQGARVILGDILEQQTAELAAELGDSAAAVRLDVTEPDDWTNAVQLAIERFGALHVLVNNAGMLDTGPIEEFTDARWDNLIAINLSSTFKGIRTAVPALKEAAPASIINISSTAGFKGFAGLTAYNAAKFGIRGITKSAAMEFAEHHVRVNSIHPGNVDTTMIEGLYNAFPHVPMRRTAAPEEITALVVFLASDESSFCTGGEFVADGGETAGSPPSVFE